MLQNLPKQCKCRHVKVRSCTFTSTFDLTQKNFNQWPFIKLPVWQETSLPGHAVLPVLGGIQALVSTLSLCGCMQLAHGLQIQPLCHQL